MEIKTYEKVKTYAKFLLTTEEMEALEKAIDVIDNIAFLTRMGLNNSNFADYSESVLNILSGYVERISEIIEVE